MGEMRWVEVASTISDPRVDELRRKFARSGAKGAKGTKNEARAAENESQQEKVTAQAEGIVEVTVRDVYCIDDALVEIPSGQGDAVDFLRLLADPIIQSATMDANNAPPQFDWMIERGYLPGVTDPLGDTALQTIEDRLGRHLQGRVYSSQRFYLSGEVSQEQAEQFAASLANPAIQRVQVMSSVAIRTEGMHPAVPRVRLTGTPKADIVDILNLDDTALKELGGKGIPNADGTRRGVLALDLAYLKAIQTYFRESERRNPTDVEVEALAQTWSEHCHHTIFADPMDNITEGIFQRYIKGATLRIRKEKRGKDFCVSVFTDNSGVIAFDENWLLTDKAETHNSPSALDPFGGAITGIVGVNRDTIGCGMGALPVLNGYYFCFGDPEDQRILFRNEELTEQMLLPNAIMEGVVEGVRVGGNCSGIPTPQGGMSIHDRYRGKPLVFVRTVGLMPREVNGRPSHEKKAEPGDYIVMVGGRVGKDGIHGATFSSEGLHSGSPATAVQIGDPITQKRLSDAIIKEARDLGLYNSITDNGAGGLSCSVAEMARESGGCKVKLDTVPLKYPGLQPWEIWISESQERMTLAVPQSGWSAFSDLMKKRGVEATVIGEFTDSGRCVVEYGEEKVMDLDLEFLHNGLPKRPMQTTYTKPTQEEPNIQLKEDLTSTLHDMLARKNIASLEFIAKQYDHEVQGGSVLKPLQGRGRVFANATVTKPVFDSAKGIVLSQGITPTYSQIDAGAMAAAAIDTAIRNAVAAGADLENIALMDNFCWCSADDPERLGQLKAAAEACYNTAVAYGTPFISGKDSMFNDFKGFDENGGSIKISVLPTLLISALGVMENAEQSVSLEAKFVGDLVYVLGETHEELGGSEYFAMCGEAERGKAYVGNAVPKVDTDKNKKVYQALSHAIQEGIIASAQSVAQGGLAVALAKTAMGGMLGMEVSLRNLPGETSRADYTLYSESQGRIVVTIDPTQKERFEAMMGGTAFASIGCITQDEKFVVNGREGNKMIDTTTEKMLSCYRSTFEGC